MTSYFDIFNNHLFNYNKLTLFLFLIIFRPKLRKCRDKVESRKEGFLKLLLIDKSTLRIIWHIANLKFSI